MTNPTPNATTPNPVTGPASFQVTVSVDNNHCHFYAICVQEAPEVFDLSIDGRLRYRAKPDAHLYEKVWNAARLCPMQAIHIQPAETAMIPIVTKRPAAKPVATPNTSGEPFQNRANIDDAS